jgi:hypothetical protein
MKLPILLLAVLLPISRNSSSELNSTLPESVSMLQLIANPDKFDGKQVGVIGFLRLEFEGNELFLHQDDCTYGIAKNGIEVNVNSTMKADAAELNMHYVLLVGTFNATKPGYVSMSSGSISALGARQWPPHEWQPK